MNVDLGLVFSLGHENVVGKGRWENCLVLGPTWGFIED